MDKKIKNGIRTMSVLALGLSGAFATTLASAAGEGFYVDGSLGRMTANISNGAAAGSTTNDTDNTYSLGGGYNVNQYFGVEGGYQDLGKVSASWSGAGTVRSGGNTFVGTGAASLSAKVNGWYLGPTVSFPINDQFSIGARAGWFNWKTELSAAFTAAGTLNGTPVAAGGSGSATAKQTDTYIGVGGLYKVNKNVGISLGYTEYKIDTYTAKNWTLGARYSF